MSTHTPSKSLYPQLLAVWHKQRVPCIPHQCQRKQIYLNGTEPHTSRHTMTTAAQPQYWQSVLQTVHLNSLRANCYTWTAYCCHTRFPHEHPCSCLHRLPIALYTTSCAMDLRSLRHAIALWRAKPAVRTTLLALAAGPKVPGILAGPPGCVRLGPGAGAVPAPQAAVHALQAAHEGRRVAQRRRHHALPQLCPQRRQPLETRA
jgi:hypothetical protein